MLTLVCRSRSEDDTLALGAAIGASLRAGDLVALSGQLGVGKTRLVRGVARGAGADPAGVSSPTYVVAQEYQAAESPTAESPRVLVHVDAYRLSGADDLDTLGWDAMRAGPAAVVVEWPERIGLVGPGGEDGGSGPDDRAVLRVTLAHDGAGTAGADSGVRHVRLDADDDVARRETFWRVVDEAMRLGAHLPDGWSRCPVSRRAVHPDCPTFPFVDEHARMADLGRWMSGSYVLSRELTEDDMMDPDLPTTDPTDAPPRGGGR